MRESAVAERRRTRVAELEFTGCEPVRVSETEILGPEWEGRKLEYWHAATETAWMVGEPASRWHERPARRLARLLERIVEARGSDVECLGSTDLRIREPDGALTDLMQADETVYLHPGGANLPLGSQLIVGEDAYPDVVLEVDNTTDVRRGKLVAYAEWGFPEVWVEVPDLASPGRPRGLHPGLVIHLLEGGRYVEAEESRAFPGWRAEEIHRALNEPTISEETAAVLWRVGRALGEREGTGPEDDSLLGDFGRRERALGIAEGHMPGDSIRGWPEWPPQSFAVAALRFPRGSRRSSPRGAGHHRRPFSKRHPRRQTRRTSSPAWADGRLDRLDEWLLERVRLSRTARFEGPPAFRPASPRFVQRT